MDRARTLAVSAAFLLAATAAAGVMGVATAQIEECGPVSLEPDAYERTVHGGDSATITFDVTNDGAVGGTAWVNVSGAPGWSTEVEPSSFPLNATQTQSVDVVATPTPGADAESSPFQLDVQAELDCSVSGVASAGSSSAKQTIDLALEPGPGGAQGSGDGNPVMSGPGVGYVLVGAVAVLSVVGYPVMRRRNRAGVGLEAPRPARSVAPEEGVSFQVNVTNTGGRPGTIHLDLEDVPEGWSGFLARPSVDLQPDESAGVDVLLRPVDVEGVPDRATVRVRARPDGREKDSDVVDLNVHLTRAI